MNSQRSTRTRLALTVIAVFAVVVVFAIRLIDIQVVRAGELTTAAVANRSKTLTTYGTRGEIVDTDGTILADSVDRFDITVSPKSVPVADDKNPVAMTVEAGPNGGASVKVSVDQALADIGRATGTRVKTLKAAISADPASDFAYLVKGVKLDVYTKVVALGIPWVYDEPHPGRVYPNGAVAGNLVGFMGTDGAQAGIELMENKCLASTNGTSTYERGADGVRIPGSTVTATAPKDGGTVKLTIDEDLSYFVQQTITKRAKDIGAQWATAVVVRVKDGNLMAVADYPTVDPNNVSAAKRTALGSLAFSTSYEPGSTFKPMTVASLMDAGKITPTTEIKVPNQYLVKGGEISDSWDHETLKYTTAGVILNSSNVGISVLSETLDKYKRHDYMTKFGIGTETAVHFNGEDSGQLKAAKDWDPVTDKTVQFGQGVAATSVQVASIYQTLANGGVQKPLSLVESCTAADGTVSGVPDKTGKRIVSKYAADSTVHMMEGVATVGWLAPQLKIPGYRVAAKTGTAEVSENGVYTGDRIVSVAGIAPADDPQYVVVATYGKPDTMKTSEAAAPTFQKIMAQVLKKYRVLPSTKTDKPIPVTW